MGARRTIIKLQPKGRPEPPTNVRAVYKGPNTISLAWDEEFNGGFDETTYNVMFKEVRGGKGGGSTKSSTKPPATSSSRRSDKATKSSKSNDKPSKASGSKGGDSKDLNDKLQDYLKKAKERQKGKKK